MARIPYDASTVFGQMTAEAVDAVIKAQANMARLVLAMDVATNADPNPRDFTRLEGGDFGVVAGTVAGANGEAFWNSVGSINTLLGQVAPVFLAAVDNGG